MEEIYFAAAVAAFALAACSLVASIVIFARANVLDAIRFLRHQPVKQGRRGPVVIPKAVPKKNGSQKAGVPVGGGAVGEPKRADQPTTVVDVTEKLSERPTGLLEEEDSERSTGVLSEEASEHPTDVLGMEPSERPTGLLAGGPSSPSVDRERGPVGRSESGGLMDDEASERPTGVLADPSERPTDVLADQAPLQEGPARASGVAQHEETTFRFILKHNEVVVHTEETID